MKRKMRRGGEGEERGGDVKVSLPLLLGSGGWLVGRLVGFW